MAHVAPRKVEVVKTLVQDFERSPVVGIVNIRGIPAPQIQAMRKKLSGRARRSGSPRTTFSGSR